MSLEGLAPGSTFAGCRLEAVAGRGGMGVVFRAAQLTLDRPVALKAIAPQFASDPGYRERFQRESQLAASIDHPNVIPVYAAGELDETLYLIMRWVDGTDLRALLLTGGRLAPADAVRVLRPVALALGAAHRRGLVHRDIKPGNVLIAGTVGGEDEHVYLTDFGIARRTDGEGAMTRTGVLVGTLDYTAPERIEGGKGDAASDIYAFGCMLFETLTGRVPFDRPTELTKMHAHLNDPVPSAGSLVTGVPPSLDAVIAKAMAKRPEERFTSAGELAAALDRALDEVATTEVEFRERLERAELATDETSLPGEAVVEDGGGTVVDGGGTVVDGGGTVVDGGGTVVDRGDTVADGGGTAVGEQPVTLIDDQPVTGVLRRPRRHRGAAAGALGALVAVGIVVAVLAAGGGGGGAPGSATSSTSSGPPTTTARTTASTSITKPSPAPATGGLRPTVALAVGGTPGGIVAASGGEVWVTLPDDGKIMRITGSPQTYTVGGHPNLLAAGPSGLWVADGTAASVARFDPGSGKLSAPVSLPGVARGLTVDPQGTAWVADATGAVTPVGTGGAGAPAHVSPVPLDVGAGEGWVWAVNGDPHLGLIRIGGGTQSDFDAGSAPVSVTFDSGVWTAHQNGHVTRFNPQPNVLRVSRTPDGRPADALVSPQGLDGIAATEMNPDVWAISTQASRLYRISYSLLTVTGSVTLPAPPVDLAVTAHTVWVATRSGQIVRIAY